MGTGFDHRHQHHHFFRHKTLYLPMFCRLSIKDIKLNHRRSDPQLSDEPSSPKVSCIGQVKRNNRVIGFPSSATAAAAAAPVTTHHHRYSKLKKLFSSKTLLPPATSSIPAVAVAAAAGGRSGSMSCRSGGEVCVRNLRRLKMKKDGDGEGYVKVNVDVGELDPPLPVVKKAAAPGDEVNIWKRRFNGAALKDLQIEQICLRKNNSELPTV